MPMLTMLKTSIAYGNVAKATTKRDTAKLINSSINTLIVDSIYTKTTAFAVDRIRGTVEKDTLKVVVSFTPVAIGNYTDTLYLRNNSASLLVKIPLSGNGTLTGIQEVAAEIPVIYSLAQNYPNPFNPTTTIEYSIPSNAFVTLKVLDLLGKVVATAVNQKQNAGRHYVTFDGTSLPSGIYLYRLQAADFLAVKKFVLLK